MKNCHCVLTIFGATGDLTHRKLLPALYFLESERNLKKDFLIMCVARRPKTDEGFRKEAAASIRKFSRNRIKEDVLQRLLSRIHYQQLEFTQQEDYAKLRIRIESLTHTLCSSCERIFYFAVAPEFFQLIIDNMASAKIGQKKVSRVSRVVFEKPFGHDLKSAHELNKTISRIFDEHQIYRIDHYLAKELVQNLLVLRFGNSIFEPLWNRNYIDSVQITVAETLGVETRAGYYDKAGALRDVVQNHIMQLLCLVAMEEPKKMDADAIRDEKVKVLKSVKLGNVATTAVKGQYSNGRMDDKEVLSYRKEQGIPADSKTGTYFALKLNVNNPRWKSVPFYVRTGKRLKERATEIAIIYKNSSSKLITEKNNLQHNMLVIRVQPDEGILLGFNTKVPGTKLSIATVNMDFCHECKFGPNSPEAYERLLLDVIQGDQTLFTRWDEVEYSWKIIDRIAKVYERKEPRLYPAGSWGPAAADKLLQKDSRSWSLPKKPYYAEFVKK